jgi:hypothetical protein
MNAKTTPLKQGKRKSEDFLPTTPSSTATVSTTVSPKKQSRSSNPELSVLFWNGSAIAIACVNAYNL